jgi:hypothetical protein
MLSILYLRSRDIHDTMDYIRLQMEEGKQEEGFSEMELLKSVQQCSIAINKVNQAIGRYTSRTLVTKGQGY